MVKSDYEERWGYVKGHVQHERERLRDVTQSIRGNSVWERWGKKI